MKNFLRKSKDFIVETAKVAVTKVKDFVVGFYQHAESVVVLSLGAYGLCALLGELPFWVTLPFWVEGPMVIPVVSVLIICGIMKIAQVRNDRRMIAAT